MRKIIYLWMVLTILLMSSCITPSEATVTTTVTTDRMYYDYYDNATGIPTPLGVG